jgi:large repetitive protein
MKHAIIFLGVLNASLLLAQDITGTLTPATNQDCNNGAIDLTLNGGSAPYSFSWSGSNGYTSGAQNIANLSDGQYEVTVYDDHCC